MEKFLGTLTDGRPIPAMAPGHTGHNQFVDLTSFGPPPAEPVGDPARNHEPNSPANEPQHGADPFVPNSPAAATIPEPTSDPAAEA